MRWRAGVSGEMRLVMGQRVFAIRSVRDPDEGRRALVLDCEETTP
jgi:head-tail adaptor